MVITQTLELVATLKDEELDVIRVTLYVDAATHEAGTLHIKGATTEPIVIDAETFERIARVVADMRMQGGDYSFVCAEHGYYRYGVDCPNCKPVREVA